MKKRVSVRQAELHKISINTASRLEKVYRYLANNAWAIFTLWALWLTVEYFGLGPFSHIRMHDLGDGNFPMRLVLIQDFFQHGFSYWFPYAACGIDRLATGLKLFQISNLFFFTLPGWLAYGIVTFLQRFLAGYFTYRLCRDCLELDRAPSIVAGLAYSISFSRLLYGSAHHAMLYGGFAGELGFPFILWTLERIVKREGVTRYLFAFLLGLFAVFSSSFTHSVPFILPMALAWFVLVRRQYSFRFLSLYAIFAATVVVGKTPTIWAMLVNAPLSHRADKDFFNPTWGGWSGLLRTAVVHVRSFLKTNFVYWGLGLLALFWRWFKERPLVWIMLLLVFCAIVARFSRLVSLALQPYMGHLSGFQVDRFYNLAPFFAAVAAGYGLHLVFRDWTLFPNVSLGEKRWPVQRILCIVAMVLLVFHSFQLKLLHGREWVTGNSYALCYQNVDMMNLADDASPSPFRVATIADSDLHAGYANAYGLETVDGYVGMYPERYQGFWSKVIEPLTSQDEARYNYFHDWGNRIYLFSPSGEGFEKIDEIAFSDYYDLELLSLANAAYIISPKPIAATHLTLLESSVPKSERVWADLSTLEKLKLGIKNIFSGRELYTYRNESCLPRCFLVDDIKVFEDPEQLLEAMAESDIEHLRDTVFVESKFASSIKPKGLGFVEAEVAIVEYSPDRIVLAVKTDGPGVLVVTNSYSPYWTAQVDGVAKDLFPAYHAFSGMYVEPGEETVVLEYHPPYWSFY